MVHQDMKLLKWYLPEEPVLRDLTALVEAAQAGDQGELSRQAIDDDVEKATDDEADQIPLTDPQATLEDVAARFGLDTSAATQLVKNGQAGGQKRAHGDVDADSRTQRYRALDKTADILAQIIDPTSSKDLLADWHRERVQVVSAEEEASLAEQAVKLMEAVKKFDVL